MRRELDGKNAVVTGSNRGIGAAVVKKLAENGANIWACARHHNEEFEKTIKVISKDNNVIIKPVYFELNSEESIKKGFESIFKEKKNIDILVNNAGIGHAASFPLTSSKTMEEVFLINTFAPMILTRYVLKRMTRQRSGSIINIASTAGMDSNAGNCIYGPSKAAIISFSKCLGAEMAPLGIRVNAVAPGASDTEMVGIFANIAKEHLLHRSAMERLANPDEIAETVVFLASSKASFINGQVIRVDGGSQ
ncbi:MAG: SDR family oxidoreductase [Clostridiales bacterium]|nr:SDR family oxidoreductase [Clostridiales bacterium]